MSLFAVSLSQAKTIAVVLIVVLVLAAVAWAWLMKTIMQKVIGLVVLLGLAGLVWSQRADLQSCADQVRAREATTCSLFGQDVDVPASRR